MRRHGKKLQHKSRKHEVVPDERNNQFLVTSASSGTTYAVRQLTGKNVFRCTCRWAQYHNGDCSHTLAVRQWLEIAGGRSLAFHSTKEDAERQHRVTEKVSRGLWATSRRRGAR